MRHEFFVVTDHAVRRATHRSLRSSLEEGETKMDFKLPEVFDIWTTVDGRRAKGSYARVLGLTVYYRGDAEAVPWPEREEDVPVVARKVLEKLVRERHAKAGSAPRDLPAPVHQAAAEYLDCDDEVKAIEKLVRSFGDLELGTEAHEQVACLLLNTLSPIVIFWEFLCDDDLPMETLRSLKAWYVDRSHEVDWKLARQAAEARRDGEIIVDCDACRAEPIATSVAACASFLHGDGAEHAVEAICHADDAQSEGCWPESEERSFQRWLVEVALPKSCRRELID